MKALLFGFVAWIIQCVASFVVLGVAAAATSSWGAARVGSVLLGVIAVELLICVGTAMGLWAVLKSSSQGASPIALFVVCVVGFAGTFLALAIGSVVAFNR